MDRLMVSTRSHTCNIFTSINGWNIPDFLTHL